MAADDAHVFRRELRGIGPRAGEILGGVFAFQDRSQKRRIHLAHGAPGGGDVRFGFQNGHAHGGVFGQAHLHGTMRGRADRGQRHTMSQHGMMPHLVQLARRQLHGRRKHAVAVGQIGEAGKLVDGEVVRHSIGEPARHETGVVREVLGRVARLPAAHAILKRLRQVPMEERGIRLDAGCQQRIHQPLVVGDALFVGLAGAVRKDARPGDGEPVGLHPEPLHELNVLGVAMVLIHRDVAGIAMRDTPGLVRVGVPHGGLAPVFLGGAFYLVSGGGAAPKERIREAAIILRARFPLSRRRRGGGGWCAYSQGGSSGERSESSSSRTHS